MDMQYESYDIKGFVKRQKRIIIMTFLMIFFTAIVISFTLPEIYKSTTTILIEDQKIPKNYVESTITGYAQKRLEVLSKKIMTTERLKEIVKRFNMYKEKNNINNIKLNTGIVKTDTRLETLSVKMSDKAQGNFATIGFTLSFESEDPETALYITSELTKLYLDEEIKARKQLSSSTTVFIQKELDNLREHIRITESKIGKFKEEHVGELPENNIMNIQAISRLENEIDRAVMRIRFLQEKQLFIKSQLSTIEALKPIKSEDGKIFQTPEKRLQGLRMQLVRMKSTMSDKHPDIKKIRKMIKELDSQLVVSDDRVVIVQRLKKIENKIIVAKSKLGSKHPDVSALEREKKLLSKELDNLLIQKTVKQIEVESPDNPTYINLMTQIAGIDLEIKGLIQEKEKIGKELQTYRTKVENAPLIEQKYNELTRDYENTRNKYDEISRKQMQARIAQGMEDTQLGRRFTIIEPAQLPRKPYKPNKFAIIAFGFVLAAGVGICFGATLESLDDSIKNTKELNQITGLPVFSVISMIKSNKEKNSELKNDILWTCACFIGIFLVVVIINKFLIS